MKAGFLCFVPFALAAAGCATTAHEPMAKQAPLAQPVVEVDAITGSRIPRSKGENYQGTKVIVVDGVQRQDMMNQKGDFPGPRGR